MTFKVLSKSLEFEKVRASVAADAVNAKLLVLVAWNNDSKDLILWEALVIFSTLEVKGVEAEKTLDVSNSDFLMLSVEEDCFKVSKLEEVVMALPWLKSFDTKEITISGAFVGIPVLIACVNVSDKIEEAKVADVDLEASEVSVLEVETKPSLVS